MPAPDTPAKHLITVPALRDILATSTVSLLDVRWALGAPDGLAAYRDGHIPGAVYVDLETELAGHGPPTGGRHPLPTIDALQVAARRWGLSEHGTVVVYDDIHGLSAARAWWLLRWAGVADVRLLDGGLAAWRAAGLELEAGVQEPPAGDITLTSGNLPVLDDDDAAALAVSGLLLDARAPERYRGETEPIDPKAGHIPGAVNAPAASANDDDGLLLPPAQLAERFATLGASPDAPVGVYCGSGVTASYLALALEVAGLHAALYPGSWSAWSNQADRPVAQGANP